MTPKEQEHYDILHKQIMGLITAYVTANPAFTLSILPKVLNDLAQAFTPHSDN